MNTNAIIGFIALIAVAGGGAYVYTQTGADVAVSESMNEQATSGSLKDLMTRSASKCTVSSVVANSESTGEVYVGNGKMRADFTTQTQSPAMTIESHMVSDGEFIYTWRDGLPHGVKLSVAFAESSQADASASLYAANVDYNCESWSVDASKFDLPSGVEFNDVGAMIENIQNAAPGGAGVQGGASVQTPGASVDAGAGATVQMCAVCDMAPEPQRTQCREVSNCK